MTLFEFLVPLIALAVAGVGTALLRKEAHAIDQRRSQRK